MWRRSLLLALLASKVAVASPETDFFGVPPPTPGHKCKPINGPWTDSDGRVERTIWSYHDPVTRYDLHVLGGGHLLAAFDAHGRLVWKNDPHAGIPDHGSAPACIVAIGVNLYAMGPMPKGPFKLWNRNGPYTVEEGRTGHYIQLRFDNSQFGFIEVRTGKFIWLGQT
jgi:hypothetical protein